MRIWKNTSTLDGYDEGLIFTENKNQADVALLGSKSIDLDEFENLKGIFRAGIGKDNVPEKEAREKGILVRYPSQETIDIIYEETASYTCSLIFRIFYSNLGTIDPWSKNSRMQLKNKSLLVIGTGNIGQQVTDYMRPFMDVITFDVLKNNFSEIPDMICKADCITIHIPKTDKNIGFFDKDKMAMMKDGAVLVNTARGSIVDEDALFAEISSGRLRAAFDVFWQEPYIGKLKKFHPDKFYMSPHIAGYTDSFLLGCRKALDSLMSELSND